MTISDDFANVLSKAELSGSGLCRSFVTGSMAYGTPHENSDFDLVILVSFEDMIRLRNFQYSSMTEFKENPDLFEVVNDGQDNYDMSKCTTACLRFGKLNLIALTEERDFLIWKEGTEELIARKPVTREEAVTHLSSKRRKDWLM
jgi:predicted nucleotidyltransferase